MRGRSRVLDRKKIREDEGLLRLRALQQVFHLVRHGDLLVHDLAHDQFFGQAAKDIEEIKISSDKATKRARRLDNFDFEELAPDDPAKVIGQTAAE